MCSARGRLTANTLDIKPRSQTCAQRDYVDGAPQVAWYYSYIPGVYQSNTTFCVCSGQICGNKTICYLVRGHNVLCSWVCCTNTTNLCIVTMINVYKCNTLIYIRVLSQMPCHSIMLTYNFNALMCYLSHYLIKWLRHGIRIYASYKMFFVSKVVIRM